MGGVPVVPEQSRRALARTEDVNANLAAYGEMHCFRGTAFEMQRPNHATVTFHRVPMNMHASIHILETPSRPHF